MFKKLGIIILGSLMLFYCFSFIIMPTKAMDEEIVGSFSVELIYTKFRDVNPIVTSSFDNFIEYDLESKYFNKDNTITLNILGKNYLDRDYTINVDIYKSDIFGNIIDTLYDKDIILNGNTLNSGYEYELVGLDPKVVTLVEDSNSSYSIDIKIENIEYKICYLYKSELVKLESTLLYENARGPMVSNAGGVSGFSASGRSYYVNENTFTSNKPMYIYYKGKNFTNDKMYSYYLYMEDDRDSLYAGILNDGSLEYGEVSGYILNNKGLFFKTFNNYKSDNIGYGFVIRDEDEVIAYSTDLLMKTKDPTMDNIELKNNRLLYLKMDKYKYLATTNVPVTIKIGGSGFDNDKKYSVLLFDNLYDGDYYLPNVTRLEMDQQLIEATGYELNNMLVTFKSRLKNIDVGLTQAIVIDIYDEGQVEIDENGYRIEHSLPFVQNEGNPILVDFLDSRDFFLKKANYVIDNTSDIIKNIIENTSIDDFIDNILIKDNGKVELYDKNGIDKVEGNVGTGMIARVLDENEFNLLDFNVVVKGDVTGDGIISITDLVKVKKHLAKVEAIDGIYEVGGDVTGTGSIGITDLVKIAKDVAKIEEIK